MPESYSEPVHIAFSAESSSKRLVGRNQARRYLMIVNDSDTAIYLSLGKSAALNSGIRVNAQGGSYELTEQAGNLYKGEIHVIHGGTGSKTVLVTEGF
ncbi:hypothetical protein [Bacillus infantis]|uniref:hypothetical protein n=1 Tax=Bacillus infantis TaxID=324767 RepID=UPI003CF8C23F